jgi:hypothetical protein
MAEGRLARLGQFGQPGPVPLTTTQLLALQLCGHGYTFRLIGFLLLGRDRAAAVAAEERGLTATASAALDAAAARLGCATPDAAITEARRRGLIL